jgi:glycosyltransferase involved in cell wall biosynthesis
VFPSIWKEPFSIAIVEAMASGLVVIVTAEGGSGEILENGVNSLTFKAGDFRDLANKLQKLIDEPQLVPQLGTAAGERVRQRFALGAIVEKIERLLSRAIEGGRK